MKRQLIYGIIILLTAGLLLTTCNKDYLELNRLSTEIEIQPGLVAPIAYGSMNLKDLVEKVDSNGYIEEFTDDPNKGLLYLAYRDSFSVDTMVQVPDKLVSENYIDSEISTPTWLASAVGDTVPFFKTELFTFELDGNDRVDSIQIKGGEIAIEVMSSFEHQGLLTISSAQILDANRDTFSTVVEISDPGGSFDTTQVFLSEGYCIKSDQVNDTNFVKINYKLDLINSGSIINPDDECLILTNFNNMGFYSVFGFIDSRDLITETGSFEISLFEDNPDLAAIVFRDPRINILASNSLGIPLEVELDSVIATSSRDGSTLELSFTNGHPFQIGAPGIDQQGESVESAIGINKDSSNIDVILASAPNAITYKIMGRTEVGDVDDQHFILDESKIDLALEVLLPLDLKSSGYAFHDTLDFELTDTVLINMIESAEVTVITRNELPVELGLQVFMLDSNQVVIDSIFIDYNIILEASQVDDQGVLLQEVETISTELITSDQLDNLKNANYLLVEAGVITSEMGNKFVKFFSNYSLDFELSISADLRINTQEL